MLNNNKMSLELLLNYLRQRLLDARSQHDEQSLRELEAALDLLTQAAYASGDKAVASVLEELEDSTRDSLTGVEWKSNIPSIDAIKAALS